MDIMSPDDYHQTQSKVMSCQPLNTVFGGTRIGNRQRFTPAGCLEKFLDILVAHGVTTIDTAQSYGNSEATIGQVDAGQRFTIDTKWSPPWTEPAAAWATREQIINSANESIRKLGVNQVRFPFILSKGGINEYRMLTPTSRWTYSTCTDQIPSRLLLRHSLQ